MATEMAAEIGELHAIAQDLDAEIQNLKAEVEELRCQYWYCPYGVRDRDKQGEIYLRCLYLNYNCPLKEGGESWTAGP